MAATKICGACNQQIVGGESFAEVLDGKYLHLRCFNCTHCKKPLPEEYTVKNDLLYHISCLEQLLAVVCSKCKKLVGPKEQAVNANNLSFHSRCFTCNSCELPLTETFYEHDGRIYCFGCYETASCPVCVQCKKPIKIDQQFTTYKDSKYHLQCFSPCSVCGCSLVDGGRRYRETVIGQFVCDKCNHETVVSRTGDKVIENSPVRREIKSSNIGGKSVFEKFGTSYAAEQQKDLTNSGKTENVKKPVGSQQPTGSTQKLLEKLNQTLQDSKVPIQADQKIPQSAKPSTQTQPLIQDVQANMRTSHNSSENSHQVGQISVPKTALSQQLQSFQGPTVSKVSAGMTEANRATTNSNSVLDQPLKLSNTNLPLTLLDQIRKSSVEKLNKPDFINDTSKPQFLRENPQGSMSAIQSSLVKSASKMSLQEELSQKRQAMNETSPSRSENADDW